MTPFDLPAPVPLQGKPWGETRCVFRDATHEVWHATIFPGGFSSRHFHTHKDNRFYVVSGRLKVHVFDGPLCTFKAPVPVSAMPPTKTHDLGAGDSLTIEAGVWHQFDATLATCPVQLVEVYRAGLRGEDIVRLDQGGMA